jgi:multidrug efflux pump subunit AcrA (membrane-fusion protein)
MAERIQSSWRLKLGIGVALALVWWWGHGRRDLRHLLATRPRRGDLARVIREEARTRYRTVHTVSMPFPGRLQRHEVEEGRRVAQGQVLATVQEGPGRGRAEVFPGGAGRRPARARAGP